MCGPSAAAKNLNNNIQAFATNVAGEAQQIFGDASSIFQNLKGSLDSIIQGGPSQQGWSQAETNAVNSQIMENAASNARNVKAATGNAVAAIGGGNTPTASGLEAAVNTNAELGVEQQKSQQLSQATVQNYDTGRQNYFTAVGQEAQLPSMFSTSNQANQTAQSAYGQAQQSQQAVDKASNWWQPLVMAGVGAGASFLTGGLSNLDSTGSSSTGEQFQNFLTGGMGKSS